MIPTSAELIIPIIHRSSFFFFFLPWMPTIMLMIILALSVVFAKSTFQLWSQEVWTVKTEWFSLHWHCPQRENLWATSCESPWYNHNGWLGVKVTKTPSYLLTYLVSSQLHLSEGSETRSQCVLYFWESKEWYSCQWLFCFVVVFVFWLYFAFFLCVCVCVCVCVTHSLCQCVCCNLYLFVITFKMRLLGNLQKLWPP